jgi:arsenite methyltransferase
MITLARRYRGQVAAELGYGNVEFRYGLIQDLALDLELLAEEAAGLKINGPQDWIALRQLEQRLRDERPMIADESTDCVVSNCVLNLVRPEDRRQLFAEIFRVLRLGGRVAISDIVSDEDVPEYLQQDSELWSGCVSGAFREDRFLGAFEEAGFYGIQIAARQTEPWRTVEGIEFRSLTVVAHKGKQGPCLDRNQAVIYRGPFKRVEDDDDHVYHRGRRTAVCDKTFRLLQREPYAGQFEPVEPRRPVAPGEAPPFDCSRPKLRHPRETKGQEYDVTTEDSGTCTDGGDCC